MALSEEMKKFFKHAIAIEDKDGRVGPASVDTAHDELDTLDDEQLGKICECPDSDLRNRMELELEDIDFEQGDEWLCVLLGGEAPDDSI